MVQSAATSRVPAVVPGLRPIPLRDIVPWAVFAGALFLVLFYVLGIEQGATALVSGQSVHEFLHDGRHLLGIPCH